MDKIPEKSGKKRSSGRLSGFFYPFFVFVMIAFTVSSGVLGYQLGQRSAPRSMGELVDTIVLSPGDSSSLLTVTGDTEGAARALSGRVFYKSSEPCKDVQVFLGSNRYDITDELGKFYFPYVAEGETSLTVLDGDDVLAEMPVTFDFDSSNAVSLTASENGSATLYMPENTKLLELTVEVEEKGKELSVNTDTSYVILEDGSLLDFSGGMISSDAADFSVTPGGGLISFDGGVYIVTDEAVIDVVPGEEEDEIVLTEDGAQLPSGTVVHPDGTVTDSDGEETGGNGNVVLIGSGESEETQEIEVLPETYVPGAAEDDSEQSEELTSDSETEEEQPGAGEEDPSSTEEEDQSSSEEENGAESSEEEGDGAESSDEEEQPEESDDTADMTIYAPNGGLEALHRDTGISWSQQADVNLFAPRGDSGELLANDETPVITPGDSGYYEFVLENKEDYDIDFVITLSEPGIHLPILYYIQDLKNKRYFLYGAKTGTETGDEGAIAISVVRLAAKSTRSYRLKWKWQYEDWYTANRDNEYDTAAAMGDEPYILSMRIDAQQVVPEIPDGADENTRYPGVK